MFRSVASFCLSGIFALMILLPAILLLAGCSAASARPDTAKSRACADAAATLATRTTRAQPSPDYQAEWLGREDDAYRACMAR